MRAKQGGAKQTKGCSTTRLRRFGRNDMFFFAAFSFRQHFHSGNIFIQATFPFRQHFHSGNISMHATFPFRQLCHQAEAPPVEGLCDARRMLRYPNCNPPRRLATLSMCCSRHQRSS
jgi:hypothetical protein